MTVQIAARIDNEQNRKFREISERLGTTPADAIRVFIAAFNEQRGFPFAIKLPQTVEPFTTEEEATDFAAHMGLRLINEAR